MRTKGLLLISVLLLIAGTVCGQSRTYTQRKKPAKKHTYVDLGLSVKWATCNLGAQAPEDYGDYYAFGEVFTKKTYTEENCKTYHKIKNEISGNKTYDAATALLGAGWRTPTKEEAQELIDKCEWTWAEQNSEPGYKVTGPNGNSIFLPAAGLAIGRERLYAGTNGYYRTSTPYAGGDIFSGFEETHENAWILGYDDLVFQVHTGAGRGAGLSIRPVYGKRTISSSSTANTSSTTPTKITPDEVTYTTTIENNNYICNTSIIQDDAATQNMYQTDFCMTVYPVKNVIIFNMGLFTIGDENIVSVARTHKTDINHPLKTDMIIALSNGETVKTTVSLFDLTKDEYKKSGEVAKLYMVFGFNNSSYISKFRQYDIKSFTIGNTTIDMSQTGVKSATIIDHMCQEIIQKGYTGNMLGSAPSASTAMLSVTQEDLEREACNARLRSCGNFYEGLASYKDANGKYGFIDETGKVVIPCQWNSVGLFCEGLASVMDDNRRCGFIDKTGKIVVPCRWRSVYDFKDGKAEVQDDNGKWHKIDKTGHVEETAQEREAREKAEREQEECEKRLRSCGNFSEGLAYYKDANGKYGFIDETGKIVVPCKWNSVGFFSEGLATVMDANRKCGFIDKTGKVVIPCQWRSAFDFNDGKAEVWDDNGKTHKIDKTGKIVE